MKTLLILLALPLLAADAEHKPLPEVTALQLENLQLKIDALRAAQEKIAAAACKDVAGVPVEECAIDLNNRRIGRAAKAEKPAAKK